MALERLRQMEWRRKIEDDYQFTRPSSRTSGRKKSEEDEENYYVGAGVQKTKKMRKPKVPKSPTVPPGFTPAEVAMPAPPVSVWTKKKGSALFQKEEDDEELLMKRVLEESLRSHDEDNRRRMERLRMSNLELQDTSHTMRPEKEWEDDHGDSYEKPSANNYQQESKQSYGDPYAKPASNNYQQKSKQSDGDTYAKPSSKDYQQESNQSYGDPYVKPASNNYQQKFKQSNGDTYGKPASNDYQQESKQAYGDPYVKPASKDYQKESKQSYGDPYAKPASNNYQQKSKQSDGDPYAKPASSYYQQESKHSDVDHYSKPTSYDYQESKQSELNYFDIEDNKPEAPKFSKPNNSQRAKEEVPTATNDLASNFKGLSLGGSENICDQRKDKVISSTEKKITDRSEPSEFDILLHSFIRHEPPSNVQTNVSPNAIPPETTDLFNLSSSPPLSSQTTQYYFPQTNMEHHSTNGSSNVMPIQISNGRDSISSVSSSLSPLLTPYGSLDKEIRPGVQILQMGNIPFPNLFDSQENYKRQIEAMLLNQNLSSNKDYSSMLAQGLLPQYSLPSALNPYPGHLLLPQQMMQSYMAQMMPFDARMQPQSLDKPVEEQSQAQMLSQAHALSLQAQNMPYDARLQQPSTVLNKPDSVLKEQPSQAEMLSAHALAMSQAQNLYDARLQQLQPNVLNKPPESVLNEQSQAQILSQAHAFSLAQAQNTPYDAASIQQNPSTAMKPADTVFKADQPSQVLSPQALALAQAQLLLQNAQVQNLPHMFLPNQVQTVAPKQEELLQQQVLLGRMQGGKTKEELLMTYQTMLQQLKQVEEQIHGVQNVPQPQIQPTWGVIPPQLSASQYFQAVPHVNPTMQPININPEHNLDQNQSASQQGRLQ
ncbi:uncharacterized protein LOC128987647 isoform X2 [Macrosteles quadrilineatus]|nr:uncharacterized protein LOC128987647 isoform X2 [Macrosteles quadrilineatus]